MYELLKTNFSAYLFITIFTGIWIALNCFGVVKKTKKIKRRYAKNVLRIVICSALSCFWAYFFVYLNLYPISLAYSEYKNNLEEETIGIIQSIEREGNDRIHLTIDNTKYTMVHSSVKPFANIGKDIVEGDTVKIRFGEKSKYIFDICELNVSP